MSIRGMLLAAQAAMLLAPLADTSSVQAANTPPRTKTEYRRQRKRWKGNKNTSSLLNKARGASSRI